MDMDFEIVRGVQFGFDVGGSYVPPEQDTDGFGVFSGTAVLIADGKLADITSMETFGGTAVLEE